MSWKNFAPMSCEKHRIVGRNKMCCCGGHNLNNPKKNKLHSATRKRLAIRMDRSFRLQEKTAWLEAA